MKAILVCVFALLLCRLSGQENISGTVYSNEKPVADAIVMLLRSADSALVKTEFTSAEGQFAFEVPDGAYLVRVTAMGFKPVTLPASRTMIIKAEQDPSALKEVAVVAKKNYIERQKGMTVLNVENSINADGSSAFEILEKAPGVRADNNDNLSLNGKQGVAVWIDGKPLPMTGSDLANYLRGIPSSSIEKIELITNPPAKYDAAGTSIIHIRLRKDKRVGTNGNVSVSYGQGVYPKSNNSISLNHRDRRVNLFGSYSYAHREMFSHLALQRQFFHGDSALGAYLQDNYLKFDFNTHIARAGADFYVDRNNTIGVLVGGVDNRFNPTGQNVSDVLDGQGYKTSLFRTTNHSHDHWYNYSANVNYRHAFDSAGTELTGDLDYARYGNATLQDFATRYYDLNDLEYRAAYLLHGDLAGKPNLYSVKSDFVKPLPSNGRFEAGQKSTYVVADNNLVFLDESSGTPVFDSTKSNHFIYTENINAAYVNGATERGPWSFQLGLRAEHTHVTGTQLVDHTGFTRNYVQLFPNVVVTRKLAPSHSMELNYSRRIRRPSYDQLNPFKFYLDPTTYREGNPYLQPSITESFELMHIFKQKIYTTIGFGRTYRNIIETISPLASQPKITVQTNRNLAIVDVYDINTTLPFDFFSWWNSTNDVNMYYAAYTGNVANTQLNARGSLNLSMNSVNTFRLPRDFTAELTASYRAREVYAFDIVKPIWFLGAGIQKKIWNNNGTIRLNVSDFLYTNRIRARVDFTGYVEHFVVRRDTRVATLSFTYKFGKSSVPAARRRQGGAEDIKQRAGNGVG